ncbi:putative peroxidase [Rosa chinensis]|uniref:peroxidase n=1 Tax=Rosa chinensis TaxID=74649 RepID=A0A2P6QKL6_ROSCH|nr:putative peroxidase [Rosa chinensis]
MQLPVTPRRFDTVYLKSLLKNKGLLHSDQEVLFKGNGSGSDKLVQHYCSHSSAFFSDSMIKMGNIKPLVLGKVGLNCRKIN